MIRALLTVTGLLAAGAVLAACSGEDGSAGTQTPEVQGESASPTPLAETPKPTPTEAPPTPTPTAEPALLELVSFDCEFQGSFTILAGGRVRNVSEVAFSNLQVELLLVNQRVREGIAPFLPPSEDMNTKLAVEPSPLQPGQEGTFEFPPVGDVLMAAQRGRAEQCNLRFWECAGECILIDFRQAQ